MSDLQSASFRAPRPTGFPIVMAVAGATARERTIAPIVDNATLISTTPALLWSRWWPRHDVDLPCLSRCTDTAMDLASGDKTLGFTRAAQVRIATRRGLADLWKHLANVPAMSEDIRI